MKRKTSKKILADSFRELAKTKRIEMYIRVYCLGTVAFTCEWILGKYKVTPGELAVIYRNSLPVPLHEYLI